jgi:hypothetical protein
MKWMTWEWTTDFSLFGKDGWQYVKETPDGDMLGRRVEADDDALPSSPQETASD